MSLDGRTALVTGSSRNIGQAIATELAEAGADVGITARTNREGCEETARAVEAAGGEAAISLADLADPDEIEAAIDEIREELGPIDVLVNNATATPSAPFFEVDREELSTASRVNVDGVFLTTQRAAADMLDRDGGSIVNITGALVYLGAPNHAHSFGSKMAIEGLTRQLATELGPDGIRVNAVSPGLIDVDRDRTEEFERIEREIVDSTPLRRTGRVEEIADAVRFLASEDASFITGQTLHVNGGTYPTPDIVGR